MFLSDYIFIWVVYVVMLCVVTWMGMRLRFTKRTTLIFVSAFIVTCSLISAFRPLESLDTEQYARTFYASWDIISATSFNELGSFFANRVNDSIEIGYVAYMALFRFFADSLEAFFFFNSLASNVLTLYALHELYKLVKAHDEPDMEGRAEGGSHLLGIFCFFMLSSGILYSSITIRSGLALGLGLFGVANILLRKHRLLGWCVLILTFTIHTSSLILILILIIFKILKKTPSRRLFAVLLIVAGAGYFFNISQVTLGAAVGLIQFLLSLANINAFGSYLTDLAFTVQLREGYLLVVWGLCMLLTFTKNDNARRLFVIALIGLFLYTFAYPIHALSRLVEFFLMMAIPACVYGYEQKVRYSRYLPLVALLLFYPQYVMVFSF